MKDKGLRIGLGITCFVLALALTLQIRTMSIENSIVSQTFADEELKDSLLQWKEKYEKASDNLAKSNKELDVIRQSASTNASDSEEKTAQIKKNNLLLGLTNVYGKGIVIEVADGTSNIQILDASSLLIHDGNLRDIVNELANAGAEAIEINGQRIVSSTYIVCAGNVILVNGEKISSPCIIKAIGNQESLYGAVERAGGTLQNMRMNNLSVQVKKDNNIKISKYSGALTQKFMKDRGE